ncbi:Calx-beta domain-containing protein [Solitalea koreensis]|uniref:Calx-beta domain-containing protein n=1 Tax=Solitalea koreensis TaxID=543615 RepID=A0A521CI06_9SPHI|nr:Calx-beta domain-containing protein [Solitalea koreensis]SMO58340.1 Calx-beta domain-containing protein [Solitalea koreensis]
MLMQKGSTFETIPLLFFKLAIQLVWQSIFFSKSNFSTFKKHLLLLCILSVFILETNLAVGQSIGEYRSVATGDWTALGTWQRWNGSAWATPTAGEGYAGQYGTGSIAIQSSHIVSVNADISLNASSVIIKNGGVLAFSGNYTLSIPSGGTLVLETGSPGGKLATDNPCNSQKKIKIGSVTYASCNGGNGGDYSFDELDNSNITLTANPASNSPVCQAGTINLFGAYSGTYDTGTLPSYSWSIKDPNSVTTTSASQNPTISNAISGTYTATLTVSTVKNSTTYSNSKTISVLVNARPTVTAIPSNAICYGGNGSAALNASGGTGPYTFTSTGGVVSGSTLTAPAGSYTITATDSKGCSGTTSVTITQPAASQISIANATVIEGTGGPNNMAFTVSLNTASGCPITVDYAVDLTGTNTEAADFAGATSGMLTIPAGITSATINIPINTDQLVEITETFKLNLSNASGGTISTSQAIGTITDDDKITVQFDKTIANGPEQNSGSNAIASSVLAIQISGGIIDADSPAQSVVIAKTGGTATALSDFTGALVSTTYTLPIPTGSYATSQLIQLPQAALAIEGDVLCEADETLNLQLQSPVGAQLGANAATIYTITNDDAISWLSGFPTVSKQNKCSNDYQNAELELHVNGTTSYLATWTLPDGTNVIDNVSPTKLTYAELQAIGKDFQPGTYHVKVQANSYPAGCFIETDVTLSNPPALIAAVSSVNIVCNGTASGSITLTATGGTPPYQFSNNNGATFVGPDIAGGNSHQFTGLTANSYQLIIKDANGCTAFPCP